MKIERTNYSRKPWRLIASNGAEVSVRQDIDHPDLGKAVISGPVGGETKTECIDAALALLESLMQECARNRLKAIEATPA